MNTSVGCPQVCVRESVRVCRARWTFVDGKVDLSTSVQTGILATVWSSFVHMVVVVWSYLFYLMPFEIFFFLGFVSLGQIWATNTYLQTLTPTPSSLPL